MIEARNLDVRRGGRIVVEASSCAILPGKLTAICGPNGAGKSTLLAALAGLIHPVGGEIDFEGRPLPSIPSRERARGIGFLPQQAEAAWDVSVRTLVELGRLPWRAVPGRPARTNNKADHEAVEKAIADMGLGDLVDRPLSQLSGGERARAMMARVLAGQPRYIFADEPFASLDIGHARDLVALLRHQATHGRGLAVVMHDLPLAMNHADRVLVLDRGRIVADGAPEQSLCEQLVYEVWGAEVRWLGDKGSRALAV